MLWLYVWLCTLVVVICFLTIKIYLMKKSADEIRKAYAEKITLNTNTLIDISSRDRHMQKLASEINCSLRRLRAERWRFYQGDRELKEAVTNIAHDLRTPLTAICGYLTLLEKEDKSENAARYISMIENRTEALKQLTEELFKYSVILSAPDEKYEKVNIISILEETLASYYGAMTQKNITPVIQMPNCRIERLLNRSAISRIFGNIIGNALKYSDGDFEVSVDVRGKIIFSNTAKNLSPVAVGRLFDRFYSVETGKTSTGLGLSIAKLLTERMRGSISADYHDEKLYICVDFPESEIVV
ncbi:MAG TPA: sensor histidine kinase [Clostridiales bacterium]|nr:sensor histidine kinase [Clostridiales bacterium]